MQIFTARYHNKTVNNAAVSNTYTPVGISQGNAQHLKYVPVSLKAIAPSWSIVKMTDQDAYRKAYFQQLDNVGIDAIRRMLEELSCGKPIVLLCFEDLRKPDLWCHRRMFAEWYEAKTGEQVLELEEFEEKKTKSLFELITMFFSF